MAEPGLSFGAGGSMRESAVRPVVSLLLVMLLGAAVLVALAPAASAATFTVNSTGDDDDGSCGPSPSDCTLREAINAANNTTAKDTISFALGSGVPTISVGSTTAAPLPS